ncbi:MAG: glycosyl hydrolase [Acidobacteriota bacterium]
MRRFVAHALALALTLSALPAGAQKKKAEKKAAEKPEGSMVASSFSGLGFRSIGPGFMSGRVADIEIHPSNPNRWVLGVASGGVWITENAGTTWKPVFDGQSSYSVGAVTIDPNDPHTIWVGTGENKSQRSVAYGDGVYKSTDSGRSWKNVGLKDSEHIGRIVVDPRDSQTVFVAAQGPLWSAGGDRGLYKTTDGGESWELVLEIDEHTGVNEVWLDPRDPDTLLASTYQRRRRTWTLIHGGPGSGLWRSTDGGANWSEIKSGLPSVEMGKIGLAVSPADPDVVYAIIEAQGDAGGTFRSLDFGLTWEKRSSYVAGSPQYYNELVADPKDVSTLYSMDTYLQISEDGGRTWRGGFEKWKHVDNHDLWIDPEDTHHLIAACDGGIYESFDRGATWQFFQNLPITQYYKVSVDEDTPFYNIYGGTQDNATHGGPSRTASLSGITNRDWFVTVMGDGFETVVDPTDPDVVYSQWQYGGLVRYDRQSGETVDIQPQPGAGESGSRWNWSAPLLISPFDHKRLYYSSQRVYRSDDRGDSWRAISPDLTKQVDRNALEVMGKVQSVDAVAKNASTSMYGNIVSFDESPQVEGLLYVGTDDGLIQVSDDGGASWREEASFPGVPDSSYVSSVIASLHDADTVYATFDNHKAGDFNPYVLRSSDRGRSWTAITGGLPERGHAHMIQQDHVDPSLLFLGTEFGVFFSTDDGGNWVQLEGGLPTIAVRDMAIQRRENDLVLGTFGRGFYVLDDYSPLREMSETKLDEPALLFPVREAKAYVETLKLGLPGRSMQGDDFYMAPNPPFGAVITYRLDKGLESLEKQRQTREKEKGDAGERLGYPSWDELRAEDREEAPTMLLVVRDEEGNVVRRLKGPASSGFHRVAWDLRYPAPAPTRLTPYPTDNAFFSPPTGPLAAPGRYSVTLAQRTGGVTTEIGSAQKFDVVSLHLGAMEPADRAATLAFQKKVAELQRAALGAQRAAGEADNRLRHLIEALDDTPGIDGTLGDEARELKQRLADLRIPLQGDATIARRGGSTPPSLLGRIGKIVGGSWNSTSAPTGTHLENYRIAAEAFETWLPQLSLLIERDLVELERKAEAAGTPWTPGRVPRWQGR